MLQRLTEAHEAAQSAPWSVADAPAQFMDKMMRAIVGIEIPIERLEGKLKASQDEAMPDRLGTVRGLRDQAGGTARAMAALVESTLPVDTPGRERASPHVDDGLWNGGAIIFWAMGMVPSSHKIGYRVSARRPWRPPGLGAAANRREALAAAAPTP